MGDAGCRYDVRRYDQEGLTMTTITIESIRMTKAAAENVEETRVSPSSDIARLRSGEVGPSELLAECLDGADADRVAGWREYVDAVVLASREPVEQAWTYDGYWATVLGAGNARAVVREHGLTADRKAIRAWLSTAQAEAWRACGNGGQMPAEWSDSYIEMALDALHDAAQDAEA